MRSARHRDQPRRESDLVEVHAAANDPQSGDQYNTQGYRSTLKLPVDSDFGVLRLDHEIDSAQPFLDERPLLHLQSVDFQSGGYRRRIAWRQIRGGRGCRSSPAKRQLPGGWVNHHAEAESHATIFASITFAITGPGPTDGGAPQLPGLGGAVEIGGESSNALIPYNVDTSSTRQRAWDGHDQYYRDDFTLLHGNHLLQFGGSYQRNFDFYTRNDNGIATDSSPVYQWATERAWPCPR